LKKKRLHNFWLIFEFKLTIKVITFLNFWQQRYKLHNVAWQHAVVKYTTQYTVVKYTTQYTAVKYTTQYTVVKYTTQYTVVKYTYCS